MLLMQTSSAHRWLSLLLSSLLLLQALWVVTDAHGLMEDHAANADMHHVDMLHEHGHITSHQHDAAGDSSHDDTEISQHCCHANSVTAAPSQIINSSFKAPSATQHFIFPLEIYHDPLQNPLYRPPIA
ncbi:MAG: Unknown protein [uncultured Thiotrichaceae bacterium]|uniref:Uncharacterized protein n=1 Tax=uncultured Thiotrichaceae bacterium TaxID=298394 RepID=A0A6S6TJA7_9GAMM|nr:MAG: Unknown protein [uncultured Thiotrichaceae bacterium]